MDGWLRIAQHAQKARDAADALARRVGDRPRRAGALLGAAIVRRAVAWGRGAQVEIELLTSQGASSGASARAVSLDGVPRVGQVVLAVRRDDGGIEVVPAGVASEAAATTTIVVEGGFIIGGWPY